MRDLATIDSELRLLVAIRRLVREEEGRTPNARRIDQLLDERAVTECQGLAGNRIALMGLDQRAVDRVAALSERG